MPTDEFNVFNLPSYSQCFELMAKLAAPSKEFIETYISDAKFKYAPVENEESYHNYWQLKDFSFDYKLCNFYKDGKKVNDKMYGCHCEINQWYNNTKHYCKGEKLYDFFTRYEVATYTKEDYKEFEKKRKEWKLYEPSHKPGQKYLKKTTVIINLQTGEESPIVIKDYLRGYIVYNKYYTPDGKRELYDIETGKKVLDYGYGDHIETEKYIFFKAQTECNEPKTALMLNKETGEVTTWE